MARARSVYRCAECGHDHPKWVGRCGECQQWGTVQEQAAKTGIVRQVEAVAPVAGRTARPITQITTTDAPRRTSGVGEFDRVLDRERRGLLARRLLPYGAFVAAALRFDIFAFYFDGGLLGATRYWRLELPLLKLAGKKVIAYPYGGDARQCLQRLGEQRARPRGPSGYVLALHHVEDGQGRPYRQRLPAERRGVIARLEHVGGVATGPAGTDGHPVPECFGHGDDVGAHTRVLEPEPAPSAAEAGLHLVDDEEIEAAAELPHVPIRAFEGRHRDRRHPAHAVAITPERAPVHGPDLPGPLFEQDTGRHEAQGAQLCPLHGGQRQPGLAHPTGTHAQQHPPPGGDAQRLAGGAHGRAFYHERRERAPGPRTRGLLPSGAVGRAQRYQVTVEGQAHEVSVELDARAPHPPRARVHLGGQLGQRNAVLPGGDELGEHGQRRVDGLEHQHAGAGDLAVGEVQRAVIDVEARTGRIGHGHRQTVGAADHRALLVDGAASVDEQRTGVQARVATTGPHALAERRVADCQVSEGGADGRGFDLRDRGARTGRGVTNIRSRASLIEAEVSWGRRPGGGTTFMLRKVTPPVN